jgi:hypothetical protein
MGRALLRKKLQEWFRRYFLAEVLGTAVALVLACVTFAQTGSYIAATASGFFGEGIGFYGYFIIKELRAHRHSSRGLRWHKRLQLLVHRSTANLALEFAPAGLVSGLLVWPSALYIAPQIIKPYALGFAVGKLVTDTVFYSLAVAGYEAKQWRRRQLQKSEFEDQAV